MLAAIWALILWRLSLVLAVETSYTTYMYDTTPCSNNPFRGFMSYTGEFNTDFPKSLEYAYIGVDEVLTGRDQYHWSVIDDLLEASVSRGNHAVFRLYLDYPDKRNAVPLFINVTQTSYVEHGGGLSPDYDNPMLLDALELLVQKAANRYDNDTRLGAVQIGLVGMWGEWHTWPHHELMPSRASQLRVLLAFTSSFKHTQLMVSADELDQWVDDNDDVHVSIPTKQYGVGYHDDNFCVGTYNSSHNQDWFFYSKLSRGDALNLYQHALIGGEVQPDIQSELFLPSWNGQNFAASVAATHCSLLLNNRVFQQFNSPEFDKNARDASLLLGYHFYVSQIIAIRNNTNKVHIEVSMENRGNAPIYYESFIVIDFNHERIGTDLRYLMPHIPTVFTSNAFVLLNRTSITLSIHCSRSLSSRPIAFAVSGSSDSSKLVVELNEDFVNDLPSDSSSEVLNVSPSSSPLKNNSMMMWKLLIVLSALYA